MSQIAQVPREGPLVSVRYALGVGLGLVGVVGVWGMAADAAAPALRALLAVVGLTAAGAGMASSLARSRRDLEGRMLCAALWLVAAAALYVVRLGLGTHFDSFQPLLLALTVACFLGAGLYAMPARWRAAGGLLLIGLHFAAILTACTVVPPPNGPSPFWANHLWTRASRPWLQLTLTNNGYHFYAPDPGPAQLMWFRVEFADGETAWVRFPDHAKVGSEIERRRFGQLASNASATTPPTSDFEALRRRRIEAGEKHVPPIPMVYADPGDQTNEYHEPARQSLILIASFVRRVAATAEHPEGKKSDVKRVKVYRADYYNPPVQHFHAGRSPFDPTLYAAYYMGEYQPDGTLSESSLRVKRREGDQAVVERVQDPFLYWQLPIVRVPEDEKADQPRRPNDGQWQAEGRLMNYVKIHAGDKKDMEANP